MSNAVAPYDKALGAPGPPDDSTRNVRRGPCCCLLALIIFLVVAGLAVLLLWPRVDAEFEDELFFEAFNRASCGIHGDPSKACGLSIDFATGEWSLNTDIREHLSPNHNSNRSRPNH